MSPLLASVCYGCAMLLLASATIHFWKREPRRDVARWFCATAAGLLSVIVTLYFYQYLSTPVLMLQAGRLHLAAVLVLGYLNYRFIGALVGRSNPNLDRVLGVVTLILSLVSAATPWVLQAEVVGYLAGLHQATYGWLAPLYGAYFVALLVLTFREYLLADKRAGNYPLAVMVKGVALAFLFLFITNMLLPYLRGDYRLVVIGPLAFPILMSVVAFSRTTRTSSHV